MSHGLGDCKFSGSKPVEILEFLITSKELCDAAISLLPKYLDGNAKNKWKSYLNRGSSRLVSFLTYPEAVRPLLRMYTEDIYIEKAVVELDASRLGAEEDGLAFRMHFRNKSCACGFVFSQS